MAKPVELSPARVHFSFGPHMPEDTDKLPAIQSEAAAFFQGTPAKNIYYREDMGTSSNFYNIVRKFYRQTGSYIDSYVLATGLVFDKIALDSYQLEAYKDTLLSTQLLNTGDRAVDQALYTGVFSRHEMVMLDDLRDQITPGKKIDMVAEENPPAVADRLRQSFMDEARNTQASARLIELGNLPDALRLYQEAIKARFSTTDQRNRVYVAKIGNMVRDARKKKEPINVFVRIGHVHQPLAEQILTVPGHYNSEVTVSSSIDQDAFLLPVDQLMLRKQTDPQFTPDSQDWIPALYTTLVDSTFMRELSRQERQKMIDRILANTSVDEITNHLQSFRPNTFMSQLRGFVAEKSA